jgi:superfamily II DNA helicase RecQ
MCYQTTCQSMLPCLTTPCVTILVIIDKIIILLKFCCCRPNIFLQLTKVTQNFESSLGWLIDGLREKGRYSPKILVYSRSVRAVFSMYMWVMEELGDAGYVSGEKKVGERLVEMYHSKSDSGSVERIMTDFPKKDSHIRLLFSTIAFGMGVQIDDVDIVVHWGLEQSALQYWQEVGRCARDGRPGLAVTYAYSQSITTCEDKVMKAVADCASCVRALLLDIFAINADVTAELDALKDKVGCDNECPTTCHCDFCMCCSKCIERCNCPQRLATLPARLGK